MPAARSNAVSFMPLSECMRMRYSRDVSVRMQAECFGGICQWQVSNAVLILLNGFTLGNLVPCIEVELVAKHVFAEPDTSIADKKSLIIVVRHTTTILNLAHHVANGRPGHPLQTDHLLRLRGSLHIGIKLH